MLLILGMGMTGLKRKRAKIAYNVINSYFDCAYDYYSDILFGSTLSTAASVHDSLDFMSRRSI